jgi:hypothetical protein
MWELVTLSQLVLTVATANLERRHDLHLSNRHNRLGKSVSR